MKGRAIYDAIVDIDLGSFLNGFINEKRGKKRVSSLKPEKTFKLIISIFKNRKLRIRIRSEEDDVLEIYIFCWDAYQSTMELSGLFPGTGSQAQFPVLVKDQIFAVIFSMV